MCKIEERACWKGSLDRHVTQTYKLIACGVRESTLDMRLEYLFVELQRMNVKMTVLVIPVRCIHSPKLSQAVRADNRVRLTARSIGSSCCATLTAGYERRQERKSAACSVPWRTAAEVFTEGSSASDQAELCWWF